MYAMIMIDCVMKWMVGHPIVHIYLLFVITPAS
jgi:hypothetical protein